MMHGNYVVVRRKLCIVVAFSETVCILSRLTIQDMLKLMGERGVC